MAYSYYRAITIDESKCGTVDSTDFPVLISGVYDGTGGEADLRVVGSGGKVQNSSGFDIGFFSNEALTTQLKWEKDRYISTTGEIAYWVKVPTVSASVNTVIYMAYGDSGISTDQGDPENVWESNYEAVFHLRDGTTLSGLDSTVNSFDGTLINTPTATAGQIDGAANFLKTSTEMIDMGARAVAKARGQMTISAWVKVTTSSNSRKGIISISNNSTSNRCSLYCDDGVSNEGAITAGGRAGDAESFQSVVTADGAISSGVWALVHGVFNYATDSILIYVNGSAVSTTGSPSFTATATSNTDSANFEIGRNLSAGLEMNGDIDEARVNHSILTPSWILTEYNNQFAPATFYTIGTERSILFNAVSNSGYQAASSSYSWSHINAGNYLSVDVSRLSVPGTTVTSVTFNGDALTNIGTKASGTDAGNVSCWGMVAPDIGTFDIVVTLSAVAISASTAVSYYGVHQTSPTEGFNGATAVNVGAADAEVTITSVADNDWIHAGLATTDTDVTAEQTTRNEVTGAGGVGANEDSGPKTPAGATVMSYTDVGAAATWVIAGYALRPLPASTLGGVVVKTVNGLALASVKTVNGLAIASVKTVNGLSAQ